MYYRIFILFPNSKYVFTKSKRPTLETIEQPLEVKICGEGKIKYRDSSQSIN